MATTTVPKAKAKAKPKAAESPDTATAADTAPEAKPGHEPKAAPKAAPRSPGIPPVVTWGLLTVGAWLIYVSVKGLSPRDELAAALTGGQRPAKAVSPLLQSLGATNDGSAETFPSRAGSVAAAGPTPVLEPIAGQPNHRLAPAANGAFKLWAAAFGAPITLTDSYRTKAAADAGHAADPGRFASGDKSWHVKGLAVDVNLGAVGANPNGNPTQRATWQRLYNAATATGWCNPRGPHKGDHKEPWHFSYGGCG